MRLLTGIVLLLVAAGSMARAEETAGLAPEKLKAAREKAVAFLRTAQSDSGGWSVAGPGVSGLVTLSLIDSGVPLDDPMLVKALDYLAKFSQPDGGLYDPKSRIGNYETCILFMTLSAANKSGKYDEVLKKAKAYLLKIPFDKEDGIDRTDLKFGGAGYGRSAGDRPDLSNTAFLLDALKAAGVGEDEEVMKNALVFVSRCQNLETEHNQTEFAAKINDGGFYYTPLARDPKGLASYGSMTYAGLKSMVYAGLKKDDPRVKAANEWIRKHYTVDENPGQEKSGLFYYYHTFSKTLHALGEPTLTDAKGQAHDWRKDLGEKLIALQKENGSWVNSDERWFEGDPSLATAFALLSLKYCEMPAK